MRKISKATLKVLEGEKRMKTCCLSYLGGCEGRLQWHHNLIYGSKQSDVPETIMAICETHHDMANKKEIKEQLDWIMLSLFNPRHFEMFSRSGLYQRRHYLNQKYGSLHN